MELESYAGIPWFSLKNFIGFLQSKENQYVCVCVCVCVSTHTHTHTHTHNILNQSVKGYITIDSREIFQFGELTEVIGQRGEVNLLNYILNKSRAGEVG